ncbi:hypothetical protein L873DRAFT_1788501 [Choiromyces venosus 120613-1]|uniref:Uncharacterized protein n=1 Tax=Choiromyces venosus 120613-1 TaxID=1336337 RepID=A0A3N4JYI6_9PEZI|nr:hypothetical protein L873DRAFT_1788501 [Choiromyces venosus 120613-1]
MLPTTLPYSHGQITVRYFADPLKEDIDNVQSTPPLLPIHHHPFKTIRATPTASISSPAALCTDFTSSSPTARQLIERLHTTISRPQRHEKATETLRPEPSANNTLKAQLWIPYLFSLETSSLKDHCEQIDDGGAGTYSTTPPQNPAPKTTKAQLKKPGSPEILPLRFLPSPLENSNEQRTALRTNVPHSNRRAQLSAPCPPADSTPTSPPPPPAHYPPPPSLRQSNHRTAQPPLYNHYPPSAPLFRAAAIFPTSSPHPLSPPLQTLDSPSKTPPTHPTSPHFIGTNTSHKQLKLTPLTRQLTPSPQPHQVLYLHSHIPTSDTQQHAPNITSPHFTASAPHLRAVLCACFPTVLVQYSYTVVCMECMEFLERVQHA